jgi:hypothetical protein
MLLYDDTACAVLRCAADEAGLLDGSTYGTAHVLVGLLRTADPITRRVSAEHHGLTVDSVRAALAGPMATPGAKGAPWTPRSSPGPGAEFRAAAGRFAAKWRPLVRERRLRAEPKLGAGELWLIVLEPESASACVLASLGAQPDDIRALVLATMVRDGAPVPDWPADVPVGGVRRLVAGLLAPRPARDRHDEESD